MASSIHDTFEAGLERLRSRRRALIADHGGDVIGEVTVAQAFGGMRGVRALVCDTSTVDPDTGLIIRDIPVLDLAGHTPEAVFFLLLTGVLPTEGDVEALRQEIAARAHVPDYAWAVLRAMPEDSHPMAMLSAAIASLEYESRFRRGLHDERAREDHWHAVLEDVLDLIAALVVLAAGVYRIAYRHADPIPFDPDLDWAANYCRMLGVEDETFYAAMRLAAVLQSDHEGGNACAFACHTVASTHANAYLAVAAGFNALAGPLHGLASQESMRWVQGAVARYGGAPDDQQIEEYAWETLRAGFVIPGYGHAVLRGRDPRFTAMVDFGRGHFEGDDLFATVARMGEVVPRVLSAHGKAKNPHPNVDAGMGAVWHHFGITELPYYTVPFAVALALGMCAQLVINRALGSPIMRPRSVTTDWIRERFDKD